MRTRLKSIPAQNRSFVEAARRAQIIDCAIDTIAELGFAKASVDQIARRVGVSKGVITYHFPNKEEIVDAIIEKAVSAGRAYIESHLEFMDAHRKLLIALLEIAMNARRADGSLVIGPAARAERVLGLEE